MRLLFILPAVSRKRSQACSVNLLTYPRPQTGARLGLHNGALQHWNSEDHHNSSIVDRGPISNRSCCKPDS